MLGRPRLATRAVAVDQRRRPADDCPGTASGTGERQSQLLGLFRAHIARSRVGNEILPVVATESVGAGSDI